MKQRKYDMKAVMVIARGIARELVCDAMEDKGIDPAEFEVMVSRCVERLLVMNQNIVLMAKREYLEGKREKWLS